jgi:adenylate cyclase
MTVETSTITARRTLRFGRFALDLATRELNADGSPIDIGARAFDLLRALVENPGRVVSKAELFAAAWPGVTVDENNLQVQVSALRRLLGPRMIVTAPGRGYQFTGDVLDPAPGDGPRTQPPEQSIAVLPFVDMSEAKDQQYFADGVAEDIINTLGKAAGLRVAGRSSSFAFRDRASDLGEISTALNVAYVLEGAVRRHHDRMRITAQLMRASDGVCLWSRTHDGVMSDIFDLQDQIARATAHEIGVLFSHSPDGRLATRQTRSGEAQDLLFQARATYRAAPTAQSFATSKAMLQRAVALDPDYVEAWIEIAGVNNFAASYAGDGSRDAAFAASCAAVAKAASIDPNSAHVKNWLAMIRYYDGDLVSAFGLTHEALSRAPQHPGLNFSMGHMKAMFGYMRDALPYLEKATHIDPFDAFAWTMRAMISQNLGDFDGAETSAERAAELGEFTAFDVLAWNAFLRGDADRAVLKYSQFCDAAAAVSPMPGLLPYLQATMRAYFQGSEADAETVRGLLTMLASAPDFTPNGYTINTAARLGLADHVFAQWRAVLAGKSTLAVSIWGDQPWARALRQHPDFILFLEREGFVDLWRVYGWPEKCRPTNSGSGANAAFIVA